MPLKGRKNIVNIILKYKPRAVNCFAFDCLHANFCHIKTRSTYAEKEKVYRTVIQRATSRGKFIFYHTPLLYLYKSRPRTHHAAQMEGSSPFQRRADCSFPPRSLKIKSLKLSSLYYSRPPAINFLKNLQTWGKNACIFAFSFI